VDRLTADIDLAVDARLFADPATRAAWRRERGMQVFSLWDATRIEIAQALAIRVAAIPHLIQLKEIAGRPQDVADIQSLRAILAHKSQS
jgi:hypothetical protein